MTHEKYVGTRGRCIFVHSDWLRESPCIILTCRTQYNISKHIRLRIFINQFFSEEMEKSLSEKRTELKQLKEFNNENCTEKLSAKVHKEGKLNIEIHTANIEEWSNCASGRVSNNSLYKNCIKYVNYKIAITK